MNDAIMQQAVGEWAERTFPGQTDARVLAHLREEVAELEDALERADPEEIADGLADCHILLLTLAHRHGVPLGEAVATKHALNMVRQWQYDPEKGYDKHVAQP